MSTELSIKNETVDAVAERIRQFQNSGEIALPPNYSPDNALKSAWLKILEIENKEGKTALEVCTKPSIQNALLRMVIQGLNPDKNQCYFIMRGKKLCCDRSYFGTIAVAKMVDNTIEEVNANVVYEGDIFRFKINNKGRKELVEHLPDLNNIDKKKIVAAYAVIVDVNDNVKTTALRTYDEILQAWKQSKQYPVDEKGNLKAGSVHEKFTAEMAMRTVINYICKPIINSSNDSGLLMKTIQESETENVDEEVAEEIQQNANKEAIVVEKIITTQAGTEVNSLSGEIIKEAAIEVVAEKTLINDDPEF